MGAPPRGFRALPQNFTLVTKHPERQIENSTIDILNLITRADLTFAFRHYRKANPSQTTAIMADEYVSIN
jgi:hypothetical protein